MCAVLRKSAGLADKSCWISIYLVTLLIGATAGFALAQERIPGRPDAACESRCVASGEDAGICEKLCWIPDIPTRVRPDEVTDAVCLRICLEKGGKYADCKPRCRIPIAQ